MTSYTHRGTSIGTTWTFSATIRSNLNYSAISANINNMSAVRVDGDDRVVLRLNSERRRWPSVAVPIWSQCDVARCQQSIGRSTIMLITLRLQNCVHCSCKWRFYHVYSVPAQYVPVRKYNICRMIAQFRVRHEHFKYVKAFIVVSCTLQHVSSLARISLYNRYKHIIWCVPHVSITFTLHAS
jgi:hypothetical protein